MTSVHEVSGHQITLLRNGEEYFPRLIASIALAQHSIYLETYIFADDDTGLAIKEALQQAALKSVTIHLLLDGFGSNNFPPVWLDDLRASGVKVLWFRPEVIRFRWHRQRLRLAIWNGSEVCARTKPAPRWKRWGPSLIACGR